MRTPIVIIGAGGHAREVLDIAERLPDVEFLGFLSEIEADLRAAHAGGTVLGDLAWLDTAPPSLRCILGVGSPQLKARWAADPRIAPLPFLADPSAVMSRRSVVIGPGVVLCANAIVSNGVRLGPHVHINRGAQIAHDCSVGAFAHVAPGALLSGNATVGEGCEVGANATLLPGITVGEWSVVGAGAVVTRDVPPRSVVAGVPARAIRTT